MNRTTYRLFNGVAIGLSAVFGLTLLGVVLTRDESPPPGSGDVGKNSPSVGTASESTPSPGAAEMVIVLTPTPTGTPIPPTLPAPGPDSLPGVTIGDPTNLREGPGLDYLIVASLAVNTPLTLLGRWVGYDWYMVYWPDSPRGAAWVYAPLVRVQGDPSLLPAVEPPPGP